MAPPKRLRAQMPAERAAMQAAVPLLARADKLCPRCLERWPLTTEFFRYIVTAREQRWQSYCRACESEWITERRRALRGRRGGQKD